MQKSEKQIPPGLPVKLNIKKETFKTKRFRSIQDRNLDWFY